MTNRYENVLRETDALTDAFEAEIERVKQYAPERLLSLGKDLLNDSKYLKAELLFCELEKYRKFREITNLYQGITSTLLDCELSRQFGHGFNTPCDKSCSLNIQGIIRKVVSCMIESTTMHVEDTISTEDFFEIELLIDRIPFKKIPLEDKKEFEDAYCGFKEYALDVFLEEHDKI